MNLALHAETTDPSAHSAARASRFRTDVQALRALAIGAVVLNHLWPGWVGGGYVGVDVFFVISGFLITSHLFREVANTGRVRLGAFYARRIRRLLPAALLVLLVSVLLVVLFLPYPRWDRNALEIAASAGYVENWFLAAISVDYSAFNDNASVAQHYWSLSVEEQFYLVWPVLMLGAAALGARTARKGALRPVAIALAAIGVLSFASSIVFTALSPQPAYFVTFSRVWEFAIGGMLALFGSRLRMSRLTGDLVSAVGLALIVFAIIAYGSKTPFPGVAAVVPVVGAAAIIAAGTSQPRLWHSRLTGSRPVQWLGNVSYSLYLWHWPLIVIAPFALRTELSVVHRFGILAVALLLAWATKRLAEDGGQRWRWWSTSVSRSLLGMGAGMLVVMLAAGGLLLGYQSRAAADSPTATLPADSCSGPRALENVDACPDVFGPADSVVMTAKNEYFYTPPECGTFLDMLSYGDKHTTLRCDFGDGEPTAQVWLVGDSHAQQWQGAIFDLARERGWEVTTSYLGGCPAAEVAFTGFRTDWGPDDVAVCRHWARDLSDAIVDAEPDLVFTAMAARLQLVDDGTGRTAEDQIADGLVRNWERWAKAGAQVVALQDPPFNVEVRDPDCVVLNRHDPVVCARPRAQAQPPDPIALAGARADDLAIHALDLTDRFCDAARCYAVVGGIPVYYDADHLNLEYARMLAPAIAEALEQVP